MEATDEQLKEALREMELEQSTTRELGHHDQED